MNSSWMRIFWILCIGFTISSCGNLGTNELESDFPSEFYLLNKDCFGRYFYENNIAGEREYELYCEEGEVIEMTEKLDSVILKDELGDVLVLSKTDFYNGYGNPIAVKKLSHNQLTFQINPLHAISDSLEIKEGMSLGRYQFSIENNGNELYNRVFRCNKIVSFDSSNIQVYSPVTHSDIYFIDGINPCLVMEMGYFDEKGDFAGWERFSADIKSIRKLKQ